MGTLIYNDAMRLELKDTVLYELRFVVFDKLRRQESFPLTLVHGADSEVKEVTSIWIAPEIPISFLFDEEPSGALDRERIEEMMWASYTRRGVTVKACNREVSGPYAQTSL